MKALNDDDVEDCLSVHSNPNRHENLI
jgi:hypothetical protein